VYTNNESGADEQLAAWLVEVISIGAARGMRFVVLNSSVGTPHQDDWYKARELLQVAGAMRDNVIIGLHEYAGGVVTSGFIGGEPGFIQPSTWPEDTSDLTLWHMGRYRFLLKYCRDSNLPIPRILITEWGFDDLGDIKAWTDRLQKTPPYENIRGWRSLKNQWQAWFGKSEQKALAQQLFYADDAIYGPEVEGYQVFCWGKSPDWLQFDVSDALEWHAALEARAAETEPQPQPEPTPEPPPQPEPIPGPPPPPFPVPKRYVTPDELAQALAQLRADVAAALRELAASLDVTTDENREDAA
jgi:hypothetical protein